MKAEKQRRKSIVSKAEVNETSKRIIGFPNDMPKTVKTKTSRTGASKDHQGGKHHIPTTDNLKVQKQHLSHPGQSKQANKKATARFSSELVKERYVGLNLLYRPHDMTLNNEVLPHKNGGSRAQIITLKNTNKNNKVLENNKHDPSQKIDSQTPLLAKRNSSKNQLLDVTHETYTTTTKVLQSDKQRYNSPHSIQTGSHSVQIVDSPVKYKLQDAEQISAIELTDEGQQYMLQKPVVLSQPSLTQPLKKKNSHIASSASRYLHNNHGMVSTQRSRKSEPFSTTNDAEQDQKVTPSQNTTFNGKNAEKDYLFKNQTNKIDIKSSLAKLDLPVHKTTQRKTDMDNKNYGSGNGDQYKNRKTSAQNTQQMVFKRKHVSTAGPDEEYEGLFPAPQSVKADDPKPFKSVQMSMNSVKMERTQRIQDSGAEYMAKSKTDPSHRVGSMPQIAQTQSVVLSTKYSQSNISKLSTKRDTVRTQQQPGQKNNFNKTLGSQSNKRSNRDDSDLNNGGTGTSHYTMQSPLNNNSSLGQKDRRQLFENGRSSQAKNLKSYYPALSGGISQSKLPADHHQQSGKVNSNQVSTGQSDLTKMPQLQQNPSASIQQQNNTSDTSNILNPALASQPTVYKTAVPKFIPAGSIKMQQAKAYKQNQAAANNGGGENSASIRSLHQEVGRRHMLQQSSNHHQNNYGSANMNANTTINTVAFKRQLAQARGFVIGANGRPQVNRAKHVLACSSTTSSEEDSSISEDNHIEAATTTIVPTQKNENKLAEEETKVEGESHSPNEKGQQNNEDSGGQAMNSNSNTEQQNTAHNQSQGLPPISSVNDTFGEQQEANKAGKTIERRKKQRKAKMPKLIFNLMYTVYPLIKKVAKEIGFRVRTDDIQIVPPAPGTDEYFLRQSGYMPQGQPPDFDISWIDNSILPEVLSKIKPYQRISQFPGISVLANKKQLATNLMKMFKRYPEQYDFFPQTYVLPVEYMEFKSQFEKYARVMHGSSAKKSKANSETYIIKPENQCQGRGIYLVKDPTEVDHTENCVAQKYINNPFLIDDLKFDMRLYVLLYGVNPLRIFLFKDGLVRLATEPYVKPTDDNIDNLFMHLTNYAINKNNEAFVQNSAAESDDDMYDDGTHKRSFKSLIYTLKCMGKPVKQLKKEIDDLLIKTLIAAQPSLSHLYKSCQPDDMENQLCFQILGFDVLIDEDCKPWLIEVNQSPSFKADSGLDSRIKEKCVADTINLLNLSARRKQKWINQNKIVMQRRMLTGKKVRITAEEREMKIQENQETRDLFEKANLGKFKLIYPCDSLDKMANYEQLIDAAQENWEDFTTGKRRNKFTRGASSSMNTKNFDGTTKEEQVPEAYDANGKPIWRGSGTVVNYMPAWERKFQKSLQQKQARLHSLQQQISADNQAVLSARNLDPTSTKGSGQGNPFKNSQPTTKSSINKGTASDKMAVQKDYLSKNGEDVALTEDQKSELSQPQKSGKIGQQLSNRIANAKQPVQTSQFNFNSEEMNGSRKTGAALRTQILTKDIRAQGELGTPVKQNKKDDYQKSPSMTQKAMMEVNQRQYALNQNINNAQGIDSQKEVRFEQKEEPESPQVYQAATVSQSQ